eukprot:INCI3222.2.p1 GENE.INCI3222.2~~INCI3222.2.p1  ORF type:complete len:1584 (+),score=430.53 INCI3222.2:312-5063(+)
MDWEARFNDTKRELDEAKQEFKEFEATSKEVENELEAEVDTLQAENDALEAKVQKLEDSSADLKEKYQSARDELTKAVDQLAALKTKSGASSQSLQALEQEVESLQGKLRISEASLARLREEADSVAEELILAQQDAAVASENHAIEVQRLQSELKDLRHNAAVTGLQSSVGEASEAVQAGSPGGEVSGEGAGTRVAELEQELAAIQEQNNELMADMDEMSTDLQNKATQIAELNEELEIMREQSDEMSEELTQMADQVMEKDGIIKDLQKQIASTTGDANGATLTSAETSADVSALQAKLDTTTSELETMKRRAEELQKEVNEKEEELAEMDDMAAGMREKLDASEAAQAGRGELERSVKELKEGLAAAEAKNKALEENLASAEARTAQLVSELNSLKQNYSDVVAQAKTAEEATAAVAKLETEKAALEQKVNGLALESEMAKQEIAVAVERELEARATHEKLEARLRVLEDEQTAGRAQQEQLQAQLTEAAVAREKLREELQSARTAAEHESSELRLENADLLSKVDAMTVASTDAQVLAESRRTTLDRKEAEQQATIARLQDMETKEAAATAAQRDLEDQLAKSRAAQQSLSREVTSLKASLDRHKNRNEVSNIAREAELVAQVAELEQECAAANEEAAASAAEAKLFSEQETAASVKASKFEVQLESSVTDADGLRVRKNDLEKDLQTTTLRLDSLSAELAEALSVHAQAEASAAQEHTTACQSLQAKSAASESKAQAAETKAVELQVELDAARSALAAEQTHAAQVLSDAEAKWSSELREAHESSASVHADGVARSTRTIEQLEAQLRELETRSAEVSAQRTDLSRELEALRAKDVAQSAENADLAAQIAAGKKAREEEAANWALEAEKLKLEVAEAKATVNNNGSLQKEALDAQLVELEDLRSRLKKVDAAHAQAKEDVEAATLELEIMREEAAQAQKDAQTSRDKLRRQNEELLEKSAAAAEAHVEAHERAETYEDKLRRYATQVTDLEQQLAAATAEREAAEIEQETLSKELAAAQIKCAGLVSEVGELRAKEERTTANLRRQNSDLSDAVATAAAEKAAARKLAEERRSSLGREAASRVEAELRAKEFEEKVAESEAAKQQLVAKLADAQAEASRLNAELQSLKLAEVQKKQDRAAALQSEHLLSIYSSPGVPGGKARKGGGDGEDGDEDTTEVDGDSSAPQSLIPSPGTKGNTMAQLASELDRQRRYAVYLAECLRERRNAYQKLLMEAQNTHGKMLVYLRIRPMYTGGGANRDHSGAGVASIRALNDSDSVFAVEDREPQPFSFDRVFDPRSSERDVYDAAQANIVNLAQGYSSCVFAYGQTGSGKTHTMTHLNERLLAELFRLKAIEGARSEEDFAISIATLEIYNDQIRDLNGRPGASVVSIGGSSSSGTSRARAESTGSDNEEHRNTDDDGRGTSIRGLNWVSVKTYEEANFVMEKAITNRATATTDVHAHSSRSHAIVIVNLRARQGGSSYSNASLFLIDLAGSERITKSKVTGDQLKEALAINKSLSALGDVLQAIDKKSSHVPFVKACWVTHGCYCHHLGGSCRDRLVVRMYSCAPGTVIPSSLSC